MKYINIMHMLKMQHNLFLANGYLFYIAYYLCIFVVYAQCIVKLIPVSFWHLN